VKPWLTTRTVHGAYHSLYSLTFKIHAHGFPGIWRRRPIASAIKRRSKFPLSDISVYDVNNDISPEAWLTTRQLLVIGWNQKMPAVILVWMSTFIQTRITAGILTVILMRMPAVITDCMIRLVSMQQAPLAVILTRMPVRMPTVILVSAAAALQTVGDHCSIGSGLVLGLWLAFYMSKTGRTSADLATLDGHSINMVIAGPIGPFPNTSSCIACPQPAA